MRLSVFFQSFLFWVVGGHLVQVFSHMLLSVYFWVPISYGDTGLLYWARTIQMISLWYYLKMLSPHSCILGSCGWGDDPMTSERAHFQSISLSQVLLISLSLWIVTLFHVCLECDSTCLWPHKGQHGLCACIYTCNELFIHRGRLREGNPPAVTSPETDNTRADPKAVSGCSYSHGYLSPSASLLFRIPQETMLS